MPQITSKHPSENDVTIPYNLSQNKFSLKLKENDLSFESKIFNFDEINSTQILQYAFMLNESISKELYNESIYNLANLFKDKMKDLIVIKWSDRFFDNLVNDIFEKYKHSLNIFSLLYSPYATIKENVMKNINYFFDDKNGIYLTKDILERFSCMYIIKKELAKTETHYENLNAFNIRTCLMKFNDDFEEFLKNITIFLLFSNIIFIS